jgi:hypothetical protein
VKRPRVVGVIVLAWLALAPVNALADSRDDPPIKA